MTFRSSSHAITVAPEATITSISPPGTSIPILTYSDGDPPSNGGCSSGSDLTGCGAVDCSLFGCGGECGFFGCDGGCGIGFCGGGCGLLGCGPGCGDGKFNESNNSINNLARWLIISTGQEADFLFLVFSGSCLHEGGGGGNEEEEEEESSSTESCSATATPTVSTICDYACAQESDTACVTLCTSLTMSCEPTGFAAFSPGSVESDPWPLSLIEDSDDAMASEANAAASWLNVQYTVMDPVIINSTTVTDSATAPNVAMTTTVTKTTATAISASSCAIQTTSSSSYCSCDGGYGVSLSTKTNAAKSTFLVCGVTPALTVSTITPKTTTTKTTSTKTTTASDSASTTISFAILQTYWSADECPIGLTCEKNSEWNAVYVSTKAGDFIYVKGTWNSDGEIDGAKATFCGQTSTFTKDGDEIKATSDDSKYGSYVCKEREGTLAGSNGSFSSSAQYEVTQEWICLSDSMCL